MLRSSGMLVTAHPRDDHAPISSAELDFGDEYAVLMTEKDAVKCASFATARHWSVPVDVVFSDADGEALLQLVIKSIEDSRG
jgi:tetraacyldisaccharide 4'-kinase